MKPKLITLGYLLWAISVFPALVLAGAVVRTPIYLAHFVFHITSGNMTTLWLIYVILTLIFVILGFALRPRDAETPPELFIWTMFPFAACVSLFSLITRCDVLDTENPFLGLLAFPVIVFAVIFLIRFIPLSRKAAVRQFANHCVYPQHKKLLIDIALHDDDPFNRIAALSKLPLSSEKDVFLEVIDSYEKTLESIRQGNIMDPQVARAAETLVELYRRYHVSKSLSHRDNPHQDSHTDWEDSDVNHDDSLCIGATVHEDDHSDQAHDDYYVVK